MALVGGRCVNPVRPVPGPVDARQVLRHAEVRISGPSAVLVLRLDLVPGRDTAKSHPLELVRGLDVHDHLVLVGDGPSVHRADDVGNLVALVIRQAD